MHVQRYYWPRGAKWDDEPEVLESIFIPPGISDGAIRAEYPYPTWAITAGDCECRRPALAQERMARILGQPGMPDERFAFDDFEGLPHAKRALEFARDFALHDSMIDADGIERTGLLLAGPTGTGKTTLGGVIFLSRLAAGQIGSWLKYTDLVARVRATYADGYAGPTVAAIRDTIMYARIMMIDDLGSITRREPYAEDMIETIFLILDHRLAKRLPTILTTNLDEEELEVQFGAPIASRIAGLCHAVYMRGGDFRRKDGTRDGTA
jgi:DNA replication protein DnaC